MFSRIFIEENIQFLPLVTELVKKLRVDRIDTIEKYDDVFGRVRKPYLFKERDLALFIAEKKGELVKPAPYAYGLGSDAPHYYFYHQLNCIFNCEYCYLQGYFRSPDIVLFVNFEDILRALNEVLIKERSAEKVWFHAGEFSDSLALSGYLNEWEDYFWPFFKNNPRSQLELRSKSINIRSLLGLEPLKNITISFSLSTPHQASFLEKNLPPIEARLRALTKLAEQGFKYGIHLDPIVYYRGLKEDLKILAQEIAALPNLENLSYISLGTVRFSKKSYREFSQNYPDSIVHALPMETRKDGKVCYSDNSRRAILSYVRTVLRDEGICEKLIYDCMEDQASPAQS